MSKTDLNTDINNQIASKVTTYHKITPNPDIIDPTMVKPLTFKGDKPKKRKHRDLDTGTSTKTKALKQSAPTADAAEKEIDEPPEDQTWVSADTPSDIAGPIIFVLASEKPTCIACDANGKVFASPLENLIEGDPATAEPHDVRQVWIATRVAGSEGVSFKGHHGRFVPFPLPCSLFGSCGCRCHCRCHCYC